jgi:hypothetical protein
MLHRHDPFELYRVRRGELAVYLESDGGAVARVTAGPGTLVPIGSGREHTVRNESDEEVEATVVFSPGEPMERFVRAAAALGSAEPPGHEAVFELAEAHGIEITRSVEDALAAARREPVGTGQRRTAGYLTIARLPGDGDRLLSEYRKYSGVMSGVGRDHGLIVHAAAKTDSGFVMVNLWPSKEPSEAAARDPRRLHVLEQLDVHPNAISREHHEVAHLEVFDAGARTT